MLCLPWRQEINDTGICTKVSSASMKHKITLVFAKRKGETQLQVLQLHPSLQYQSQGIFTCAGEHNCERHSSHELWQNHKNQRRSPISADNLVLSSLSVQCPGGLPRIQGDFAFLSSLNERINTTTNNNTTMLLI